MTVIFVGLIFGGMAFWQHQKADGQNAQEASRKASQAKKVLPVTRPAGYIKKPTPQRVDCTVQECVALTFDDGPHPENTVRVLDVLDRYNARATFFLVGSRVGGQEEIVRRMYRTGHEIGNHSWDHANFTNLTPHQMIDQINHTQAAIMRAGVPAPTLFRPPYGAVNATVRSTVPMTIALWNADPLDWRHDDKDVAAQTMLELAHPGAVLDLHDIYTTTADSVEPVVTELQKRYKLVTFSELMNLQPGQQGEFYGR